MAPEGARPHSLNQVVTAGQNPNVVTAGQIGQLMVPTTTFLSDSERKVAEEEGFEPPVDLRPRLISSQVP